MTTYVYNSNHILCIYSEHFIQIHEFKSYIFKKKSTTKIAEI